MQVSSVSFLYPEEQTSHVVNVAHSSQFAIQAFEDENYFPKKIFTYVWDAGIISILLIP